MITTSKFIDEALRRCELLKLPTEVKETVMKGEVFYQDTKRYKTMLPTELSEKQYFLDLEYIRSLGNFVYYVWDDALPNSDILCRNYLAVSNYELDWPIEIFTREKENVLFCEVYCQSVLTHGCMDYGVVPIKTTTNAIFRI